MTQNCLVTR